MKKIISLFALFTFNSFALEVPEPIKIDNIYMSQPNNFYFRVVSQGDKWHCHNGPKNPAWSYIDDAPGSKGMMSALLTAFAAGKTVQLYTQGVDSSVGRACKIVEFRIDK